MQRHACVCGAIKKLRLPCMVVAYPENAGLNFSAFILDCRLSRCEFCDSVPNSEVPQPEVYPDWNFSRFFSVLVNKDRSSALNSVSKISSLFFTFHHSLSPYFSTLCTGQVAFLEMSYKKTEKFHIISFYWILHSFLATDLRVCPLLARFTPDSKERIFTKFGFLGVL